MTTRILSLVRVYIVVSGMAVVGAMRNTRAQTPSDMPDASSHEPSTRVTTRGVFKSDRGEFPYTAYYWPDDGARENSAGREILKLLDQLQDATTFDQLAAVYSAESQNDLARTHKAAVDKVAAAGAKPPAAHTEKHITHLIVAKNPDGSDLYVTRSIEIVTMPVMPGKAPLIVPLSYIDAYRGTANTIRLDLPSREGVIFEAASFGEWKSFGLPNPTESDLDSAAKHGAAVPPSTQWAPP